MDSPKLLPEGDEQPAPSGITSFALNLFTAPLRAVGRFLPKMFPLIVCLLCIPVLMFFSGAAGWIVWRNVPVGWKMDANLQYGDGLTPFASSQLPPIMADQPYDIILHLVLPATESNFALGNFMTTLKLTTAYNESLITIRRSTVLVPPRSSFLKQLLIGSPSTTTVDIPLLSQFVSGTSTVNARLELGRSDGWKSIGTGQARELSVLEAILKGTVRPKGLRAILARFPRLTTFVSTFTFFFISLLVVSGFIFTAIRSDSSLERPPASKDGNGSDSEDGHDLDPYPTTRRLSGRRSFKRESESGSSDQDEKDHSERGLQLSGLRKRRSTQTLETMDTNRKSETKLEADSLPQRHGTTPIYPKSPLPRSSSTSSNTSSRTRRLREATSPVSPSYADADSL